MLTLTEKQVKELEEFLQELPVKFGVPLLNLFRKFSQDNSKSVVADTEAPKVTSNGVEIEAE